MDGKRLLAVGLAVAFAVSCGGGGGATTTGASPSGAAATAAAATSAAATKAPTGTAAAGQPGFAELLAAAKISQYKITYKMTITASGTPVTGDQTWYFKPPRSRFDFTSTVSGQTSTISVFSLPEGTFMCFGAGGAPQCLSTAGISSPLDSNPAAVAQRSLVENPSQYGATFKETKTIAGQQGLCYALNSAAGTLQSGTFCFSKEGLLLLSQFTAQGSSVTMEATQVSTTVPDSDFKLPATPLTRP